MKVMKVIKAIKAIKVMKVMAHGTWHMFISNMSTFSDFHSTQHPLAMPHIWSLTTILFLLIPVERLVSRVESQQVGTG